MSDSQTPDIYTAVEGELYALIESGVRSAKEASTPVISAWARALSNVPPEKFKPDIAISSFMRRAIEALGGGVWSDAATALFGLGPTANLGMTLRRAAAAECLPNFKGPRDPNLTESERNRKLADSFRKAPNGEAKMLRIMNTALVDIAVEHEFALEPFRPEPLIEDNLDSLVDTESVEPVPDSTTAVLGETAPEPEMSDEPLSPTAEPSGSAVAASADDSEPDEVVKPAGRQETHLAILSGAIRRRWFIAAAACLIAMVAVVAGDKNTRSPRTLPLSETSALFGPERPVHKYHSSPRLFDNVTFNSLTGVPNIGDERNFMTGKLAGANGGFYDPMNGVRTGDELLIRLYIHNNAKQYWILGSRYRDRGVAKNTIARVYIPTNLAQAQRIKGFVSADNARPRVVFDTVTLNASYPFKLDYEEGSTKITSLLTDRHISDQLVRGGVPVSYGDDLSTKFLPFLDATALVTFRVRVI
jgi:hypothetical protein